MADSKQELSKNSTVKDYLTVQNEGKHGINGSVI